MAPGDERSSVPAYAERLAWLESLETATPDEPRGRRLLVRGWAGLWPVVLAIAIVLAVWELIHLSGWKKLIFPAPGPTLANLWDQLGTAGSGTPSPSPACAPSSDSRSRWSSAR